MFRLDGKVAVVTGGTRGIGRAISLSLAEAGAKLVVNYLSNEAAAEETAEAGRRARLRGRARQGRRQPGRDGAAASSTRRSSSFGQIDILVNNAGKTADNLLVRMSDEEWDSVIETNLRSTFLCTRAALRPMLRQRYGRIINITSVDGLVGNAGQANYSAAKAGQIGFTRSLAREVASRGITVNAVAPGIVKTEHDRGAQRDAVGADPRRASRWAATAGRKRSRRSSSSSPRTRRPTSRARSSPSTAD